MLRDDGVPFTLVVEAVEHEEYASRFGAENVLVLPFANIGVGQLVAVRNWIRDYSVSMGETYHWQLDDNLRYWRVVANDWRNAIKSGPAMALIEEFVDRYENIAIAGANYDFFCQPAANTKPYRLNAHVYSCTLVRNDMPFRWRGPRNEDIDICLQVATSGYWVTCQSNTVLVHKSRTMTMQGGNTHIYSDDGRLKMSALLVRRWPGVVKLTRRFGRPHHSIDWHKLRGTPLVRRADLDWDAMERNPIEAVVTNTEEVV